MESPREGANQNAGRENQSQLQKAQTKTPLQPSRPLNLNRRETKVQEEFERKQLLAAEVTKVLIGKSIAFIKSTCHTLLTSGDVLDDISFNTAMDVFTRIQTVYIWGIIKRVVMFIVFITLFVQSFQNSYITQKYVALDSTSGICEEVPKTWTGNYDIDYYGRWQGSIGFKPEHGMYRIQLQDFSMTMPKYRDLMKSFKEKLRVTGDLLLKNDLAHNILYWASYSISETFTNSNDNSVTTTFIMTAFPQYIMNNEGLQGTFASANKDCSYLTSGQSYNLATATFTTQVQISSFDADPSCSGIINSYTLGYDPTINGDTLKINVNIISLVSALAVSNKVNGEDSYTNFRTFKEITRSKWPLYPNANDAVEYVVLDRYDQQNAGLMDPITCVGPSANIETGVGFNCFLRVGNSYGIPFLSHKGDDLVKPNTCQCSTTTTTPDLCNKFDFLFGVAVYDHLEPYHHKDDTGTSSYPVWFKANCDPSDSACTIDGNGETNYPKLFWPVIPLLETFVSSPPVSAQEANVGAFEPAFSAIRGQQCEITDKATGTGQCLQCGSTTIEATITTSSAAFTLASAANLLAGMTYVGSTTLFAPGTKITSIAASTITSYTVTITGTTTSSSTSVTAVASASSIVVGSYVTGTGIAAGTTVTAVSSTTVTLSTVATASGTGVSLTFGTVLVTMDTQALKTGTVLLTFNHACTGGEHSTGAGTTANPDFGDLTQRQTDWTKFKVNHYGIHKLALKATITSTAATTVSVGSGSVAGMRYTLKNPVECSGIAVGSFVYDDNDIFPGNTEVLAMYDSSGTTSATTGVMCTHILIAGSTAAPASDLTLKFHDGTGGFTSLILFNSFSELQQGVTPNNYQLKQGACFNSLLSPYFDAVFDSAWGALEEVYFQCTMKLGDSILNSAGIAAGTAGLLVPSFFFTFMFIVMAFVSYQHTMEALDNKLAVRTNLQAEDFDPNTRFTRPMSAEKKSELSRMELYHCMGYVVDHSNVNHDEEKDGGTWRHALRKHEQQQEKEKEQEPPGVRLSLSQPGARADMFAGGREETGLGAAADRESRTNSELDEGVEGVSIQMTVAVEDDISTPEGKAGSP